MDALIFSEGNGYGHAARDSIIAQRLGLPIITFGKGAEYCRMHGIEHTEIPAPYRIEALKGKVEIKTDIKDILSLLKPEAIATLRKRFSEVDHVIVDGSSLGLAASLLLGRPTLFITNDTSSLVGVYGNIQKRAASTLQTRLLRLSKRILVPDYPPPMTITALNLDPSFPLSFGGPLIKPIKARRHSFRYAVSGPLAESLRPMLGDSAVYGSAQQDISPYFAGCEAVICHGGHSTMMEALSLGKPVLAITDRSYSERYNNALTLERLGLGVLLEAKLLSERSLEAALAMAGTCDEGRLSLYKRLRPDPIEAIESMLA